MKLTKEQEDSLQAFIGEAGAIPDCFTRLGVKWACENLPIAQWNKYPEVKPEKEGRYLRLTSVGPLPILLDREGSNWIWNKHGYSRTVSSVTDWVEINPPRREQNVVEA